MTVLSIALGVFVVAVITAFTGYFVAQEFAYMSVDRSRLQARAAAGDSGAKRALGITRRTSFMLSGAQLGITVTGLLVGYVAEPLIGQAFGEILGGVGVPVAVGIAIGAILAVALSTVIQMVFGELFPKNLAIARPEPLARALALSTSIYLKLFGWLISLFDKSSNLLLRAVKIEPVHDVEHSATARDLEHIVAESRDAGDLPRDLSTLLDRVIDFPERTAEHAMVSRSRADVVEAKEPIDAVLARMATGHTRYPVIGESVDDLVGVVHLHDLLGENVTGTAGDHAKHAIVVAESQPLADVLDELSSAREEMALVVDEYGGFAGIVTIEDMAEELVGEIEDEHDPDGAPDVSGDAEHGWTMSGELHLDEVERMIEHDLPETDNETIAGLVIETHGSLPDVGDSVEIDLELDPGDLVADEEPPRRFLRATVDDIEKYVPSQLTVTLHEEERTSENAKENGHE
ncbi:HlyC/CorC family transporter [Rhodococcus rhodnii]|uniref:Mg2 n=2 Tax=Rhodococcus rhodnii TaxID=38312 RepID=R7WNP1_9NOCA|nr:hemolysin family protein [Rhodococcus rhodnii]EOM76890.1 Mg2+ [Rhodococcus rhodnii LMG 5362]TXG89746.1 HlyC/CorC family transporter [Rhodococcus rhodnii]